MSKNISVADIQKSTGLNKNTIYGIVSGNSINPAAQNLQLITRVLGVSLESILIDGTRFNFDNLTDKQLQAFSDATVITIKTIIKKINHIILSYY
jgi:transcriptional regulator with XRE-family HTH domain